MVLVVFSQNLLTDLLTGRDHAIFLSRVVNFWPVFGVGSSAQQNSLSFAYQVIRSRTGPFGRVKAVQLNLNYFFTIEATGSSGLAAHSVQPAS